MTSSFAFFLRLEPVGVSAAAAVDKLQTAHTLLVVEPHGQVGPTVPAQTRQAAEVCKCDLPQFWPCLHCVGHN